MFHFADSVTLSKSPVAVVPPDSPNLPAPTDQAGKMCSPQCLPSHLDPPPHTHTHTDGPPLERKQSDADKITAWKKKLGPKLPLEIEQRDMTLVAGLFDNMELYFDQLGLKGWERCDVRAKALLNDTQVGMSSALSVWKSHDPWHATYGALLDIVLKLEKESVALKLCEYLDQL